jgi:hypothetical protein
MMPVLFAAYRFANGAGNGTPEWLEKADSSPLKRIRNGRVLWSGIAAVGWVRCPEI